MQLPPRTTITYTLFPHATVFRSLRGGRQDQGNGSQQRRTDAAVCRRLRARHRQPASGSGNRGGTGARLRRLSDAALRPERSEEQTSELQSLMRISYAVFCLKKKSTQQTHLT